jgi:20S proteasome subunit alpha 4
MEKKCPKLYLTEPSGIHSEWLGNAIGRNSKAARDLLESKYDAIVAGLEESATIKLAVQALLEVVQSGANYVEVAVMSADGKVKYLQFDEVKTLIEEIDNERIQQQQQQ